MTLHQVPNTRHRYYVTEDGRFFSELKDGSLAERQGGTSSAGYKVQWVDDRLEYLHRLIAITFVPNPSNKMTVNHIDGNKLNNCASNLEWLSVRENMLHAHQSGLMHHALGERVWTAKLTRKQVLEILNLFRLGYTRYELASKFSVSHATISAIITGRSWSHVTGIERLMPEGPEAA